MSLESKERQAEVHGLAISRHLQWAQDFVTAGDYASAVDELLDVQALKAEIDAS